MSRVRTAGDLVSRSGLARVGALLLVTAALPSLSTSCAHRARDVDAASELPDGGHTSLACAEACDCPERSSCLISGECEEGGCTSRCDAESPCPCGRACVDGVCDYAVGTLASCELSCTCPPGELCAGGRCVRVCGGASCSSDDDCAPCGRRCGAHGQCVELDQCTCHTECRGEVPRICDREEADLGRCVVPAGSAQHGRGGAFATDRAFGEVSTQRVPFRIERSPRAALLIVDLSPRPASELLSIAVELPDGRWLHGRERRHGCELGDGARQVFDLVLDTSVAPGAWVAEVSLIRGPDPLLEDPVVLRDVWLVAED